MIIWYLFNRGLDGPQGHSGGLAEVINLILPFFQTNDSSVVQPHVNNMNLTFYQNHFSGSYIVG